MDPKMIEMNNLRVLNDYLTQTLEVLGRGQRFGVNAHTAGFGYSPFAPIQGTPAVLGTDTVYGQGPWGFGGAMYQGSPFAAQHAYTGHPGYGASYGANYGAGFGPSFGGIDPFQAQRGLGGAGFGGWQQPWGQGSEVSRQAQFTQALAAKQSVLEAMCRACGIPV